MTVMFPGLELFWPVHPSRLSLFQALLVGIVSTTGLSHYVVQIFEISADHHRDLELSI